MASLYGVLRPEGYTERAIFVIDKQGIIRYVDVHDIDLQPDNEVLFGILDWLEPVGAAQYAARTKSVAVAAADATADAAAVATATAPAADPAPEVERPADVIMYCTPWCPGCRRARVFFREHNINFVEINIMQDRTAAQRVRDWSNGKEITPTLDIQGTIVVEFDQARVAALLGIKV